MHILSPDAIDIILNNQKKKENKIKKMKIDEKFLLFFQKKKCIFIFMVYLTYIDNIENIFMNFIFYHFNI